MIVPTNLWVLSCDRSHPHNHAECFYPATSDDLVGVLADPEVQEALGAVTGFLDGASTQGDATELIIATDREAGATVVRRAKDVVVVPLSRLEDTDE